MSMPTSFLINISEIDTYITHALEPYLGPAVHASNFSDIILSIYDMSLSPYTDDVLSPYSKARVCLEDYQLPDEFINVLLYQLLEMTNRTVKSMMSGMIGLGLFKTTLVDSYTLRIDMVGMANNNEPTIPNNNDFDPVDDMINRIHQAHENGDWLPPKMREFAKIY